MHQGGKRTRTSPIQLDETGLTKKGKLLPALALNIGIGRKQLNMDIIPTGLVFTAAVCGIDSKKMIMPMFKVTKEHFTPHTH